MKFSATTLLLTAALGVSAHPSPNAHRHAHRSVHERDFVMAKKPVIPLPQPTTSSAPPPPPPASSTAAAAPASSSAPAKGGSGDGSAKPFCGGSAYSKRATIAEIAYAGNLGKPGSYGCNLMLVDNPSAYKYSMTFENKAGTDQACACWLKIGPTGGINGFFKGNQVFNFKLPAGGTQGVAADENTQGACSCSAGSDLITTTIGEFGGTWAEFDMGNESNGGWSGFDASCLVAAKFGIDIPALSMCGHGTCSTVNAGGTGTNAFLGGMEAEDGIGGNLAPGPVSITVTVG